MTNKHIFLNLSKIDLLENRRIYLPYCLASLFCVGMVYALLSLSNHSSLLSMTSGSFLASVLSYGAMGAGVFSALFLLRLNVFLARYRNRAFQFYTTLGMQKKHIARIIFYESVLLYLVSSVAGVVIGTLIRPSLIQMLSWIMQGQVRSMSYVPQMDAVITMAFFFLLYLFLFVDAVRRIRILDAQPSYTKRNKEPNSIRAALGLLSLVFAYVLIWKMADPMTALRFCILAFCLMAVGTYFILKDGVRMILDKIVHWKWMYLRPKMMVGLSNIRAHMALEGRLLADICVLTTVILLLLSSTFALWSGMEQVLNLQNPRDVVVQSRRSSASRKDLLSQLKKKGIKVKNEVYYPYVSTNLYREKGEWVSYTDQHNLRKVITFQIITVDTYDKYAKSNAKLDKDEVFLYAEDGSEPDQIRVLGKKFRVKKHLTAMFQGLTRSHGAHTVYYLVVSSDHVLSQLQKKQENPLQINVGFDVKSLKQVKIVEKMMHGDQKDWNYYPYYVAYKNYIGFYGAFFFVVLLASLLLLMAVILSMYYQNILDGYEQSHQDQNLVELGMDPWDLRKSVRIRTGWTFFLPLSLSGVHFFFSFPMMNQLLRAMGLVNIPFFMNVCLMSFVSFGLVYVVIYEMTVRTYIRMADPQEKAS